MNNNPIGFGLLQAASLMSRHADNILQENISIGYSQYKILSVLVTNNGYRQIDIANRLGQTEASISRQIKLLEDYGLIKIKVNSSNRREHFIQITLKGARRYEQANRLLNRVFEPMFGQLNNNQLDSFYQSLSIISDYLERQ